MQLFILIFSLLLPTQLGKHFFYSFSYLSGIRIDYLAPTLYSTDILSIPLGVFVIIQLYKNWRLYQKWVKKHITVIASLVVFLLLNFFFSLSKPLWVYGFFRGIQFMFLFLFFQMNGNKKKIYTPLLWGLLTGACLELILCLSQLSLRHSLQGVWYYLGERSFSIFTPGIAKAYFMGTEFLRPYGTFSHPNSLGGFYLLIYTFVLTQKKITNGALKIGLLLIASFLVILSFSRTAIAVYVFVNIIYFSRSFLHCKVCTVAKIGMAIILIFFAFNITGDINSLNKRADFADKSLSIIAEKPFTGTGIGSYLIAQHAYPQHFSTFFEQPVHSIFLLTIAQLGLPISLLFLFLLIKIIGVKIKHISFFLPLLVVILTGGLDHYWITLQQNVLVLATIFGILLI